MSAVLAVVAPAADPASDAVAARMLVRMRSRGVEGAPPHRAGATLLAVVRHPWEMDAARAEHDGACSIVTDATLYYRDDLRRRLRARGVEPAGATPGHLILAAYRVWGEACAQELEGDFAFVLWDGDARSLFCARDFGGKRPLFHARVGGGLVVASTVGAIRAHPGCPADLNPAELGAAAAAFFAVADETCDAAVRSLPAGHALVWNGGEPRVRAFQSPPEIGGSQLPFAAAAEELRVRLQAATRERLCGAGPCSVWLSGGYDSTAVLASARDRGEGRPLHAVSMSYPPGDPGREDEMIKRIAEHWGSPVHWTDAYEIPLLDDVAESARDEPFAHTFRHWNRALARGSRRAGARVALDGAGGDALFQLSPIYLADLVRGGRWGELAREWRTGPVGTPRALFRWAVQPLLSAPLLSLAARLRGGAPLHGPLEPRLPPWIRADYARRHALLERERAHTPARGNRSHADFETHWQLAHAYFPRVSASLASLALAEGVELRSPLSDRRVMALAAARPREERASGGETKRLLRAAMRGLLPDDVLAPRRLRTGVTTRYFARSLRQRHRARITALAGTPLLLEEAGIVEGAALRRAWNEYLAGAGETLGLRVLLTLQTELWLRGRHAGGTAAHASD